MHTLAARAAPGHAVCGARRRARAYRRVGARARRGGILPHEDSSLAPMEAGQRRATLLITLPLVVVLEQHPDADPQAARPLARPHHVSPYRGRASSTAMAPERAVRRRRPSSFTALRAVHLVKHAAGGIPHVPDPRDAVGLKCRGAMCDSRALGGEPDQSSATLYSIDHGHTEQTQMRMMQQRSWCWGRVFALQFMVQLANALICGKGQQGTGWQRDASDSDNGEAEAHREFREPVAESNSKAFISGGSGLYVQRTARELCFRVSCDTSLRFFGGLGALFGINYFKFMLGA
ncbi:hypothetical protein GGX14DRAFT_639933 [Mycena pura]|uniref:Uncharacterized protein n=1 Tax=Mycena pura TaxID=153505 RepID=A0AAD7E2U1_9AGAR|nr:hypothetical protein GGX14DRAFT_639933 [Mycena pura]